MNSYAQRNRLNPSETGAKIATRAIPHPGPSSSTTFSPLSSTSPRCTSSSSTPTTTTRFLDNEPSRGATEHGSPALSDGCQASLVEPATGATIRRKVKAREQYAVSCEHSRRHRPISCATNPVCDESPSIPNGQPRSAGVDPNEHRSRALPAQPISKADRNDASLSSHQSSLLRCRRRLIVHEVRRLGRQRYLNGTMDHGGRASQASLIRPSQVFAAPNRTANGHRTNHSSQCCLTSTKPGSATQREIPPDDSNEESELQARTDLLEQAHVAIETSKACLRDRAKKCRSTQLDENDDGRSINRDDDGNSVAQVIPQQQHSARARLQVEVPPDEAEDPTEELNPSKTVCDNGERASLDVDQDFDPSDDKSTQRHDFRLSGQMGDVASTSGSDIDDDSDDSSSGSTTKTSNVVVMMSRQGNVAFGDVDQRPRVVSEEDDQCGDHRRGGSGQGKPLRGGGLTKTKKITEWKNISEIIRRIPFICGGVEPPSRESTTAITTYSSSSGSTATEVKSSSLPKRRDGVGPFRRSPRGEATKTKSPRHQFGQLMCVLHEKESSEWYISQKEEETAQRNHESVMEMVFFDDFGDVEAPC
jgi:hypothetical protein